MAKRTDLIAPRPGDAAEDTVTAAGRVLAAVAEHFTRIDPTDALESHSLLLCVSAEAYELAGRSIGSDSAAMSRAAMAAAPEMPAGISRGEAALLLRKAAAACGYEWGSDDNERVIPIIPGQRPAPTPSPAEDGASDTPSCCGRPMRQDGQQWVCDKCKSWHDLGGRAGVAR